MDARAVWHRARSQLQSRRAMWDDCCYRGSSSRVRESWCLHAAPDARGNSSEQVVVHIVCKGREEKVGE
jgi:hypothetical protein